jgi:carboxymethylenebutenolidase
MVLGLLLASALVAQSAAPSAAGTNLPPSETTAKAVLEKSPRHGEYVDVKQAGGGVPIRTWISYPERKDKAGVVIVIQEVFGLTDWLRGVADQLAKDGFIAVAPDMRRSASAGAAGAASRMRRRSRSWTARSCTTAALPRRPSSPR